MSSQNIQVIVRVRPLSQKEKELQVSDLQQAAQPVDETFEKECVQLDLEEEGEAGCKTIRMAGKAPKTFKFDRVLGTSIQQHEIFELVGRPLVSQIMEGYNASIFAYGQTGSGKTHSIQGGQGRTDAGLMPRVMEHLFQRVYNEENNLPKTNVLDGIEHNITDSLHLNDQQPLKEEKEYLVKVSYLEIYNEQIKDLLGSTQSAPSLNSSLVDSSALNAPPLSKTSKTLSLPGGANLQLRESLSKGIYVEGLSEETVLDAEHGMHLLKIGGKQRQMGSTAMNNQSSRSHAVFTITLESKSSQNGVQTMRSSKLHFIDLAGSERQKQTLVGGDRLKEACGINKSLTILGYVINALVDNTNNKQQRHIPYRDSKLTFLLKDSLGGNSKTSLVACVSPSTFYYAETLSTLKFAQRAKQIKNKATVNEEQKGSVNMLKRELKKLREELAAAHEQLGNKQTCSLQQNKGQLGDFLKGHSEFFNFFKLNNQLMESQAFFRQFINQYKSSMAQCFSYFKSEQHKAQFERAMQTLIKNEASYKHLLQIQERRIHQGTLPEDGQAEKEILKQLVIKQPLLSKLVEENIQLSVRNKCLLQSYDRLESQVGEAVEHREKTRQFYLATLDFLNQRVVESDDPQHSFIIKQMEDIIKDLNEQILEYRSKNLNLEVEIAHKERELQFRNGDLAVLQQNLSKVLKKEQSKDNELIDVAKQLKSKDEALVKYQERQAIMDKEARQWEETREEQAQQIEHLEMQVAQLQQQNGRLETLAKNRAQQAGSAETQVAQLKERLSDMDTQLAITRDKAQFSLKDKVDKCNRFQEELDTLSQAFELQRASLQQVTDHKAHLEQQLIMARQQVSDSRIDATTVKLLVLLRQIADSLPLDSSSEHSRQLEQLLNTTNEQVNRFYLQHGQEGVFKLDGPSLDMVDRFLCTSCQARQERDGADPGQLEEAVKSLKVQLAQREKKNRLLEEALETQDRGAQDWKKRVQELNETIDYLKSENYVFRNQLKQKSLAKSLNKHPGQQMKENQCLSNKVVFLKTMLEKLSQLHGFSTQDIKVKLHELDDPERFPVVATLNYQQQVLTTLSQIQDHKISKSLKDQPTNQQAQHSLLVLQEIVSRINQQISHNQQSQVYLNLRSSHHKAMDSSQSKKLLKIQSKQHKRMDSLDLAKSMDQIFSQLTPAKKIHFE